MRSRWLVIGGAAGAILGAAITYVGATRTFTCDDSLFEASCAGPNVVLALLWGVPIGVAVGLVTGWVVSRRGSAR